MVKKLLIGFIILLLLAAGVGFYFYQMIFSANVAETTELTLPTGSTLEDVITKLEESGNIKDISAVEQVAKVMKYDDSAVKPGKYTLKKGWNSKELVGLLRSGRQTPVKVTFNNLRTKDNLAARISSYLEIDSMTLANFFNDPATHKNVGLKDETFISLFIPNTYEMYWTADPEDILSRFEKEHQKFWAKQDRMAKAKKAGFSPEEIYTLASLVEKESIRNDEKPTIAGVYMNRLEIGMPLQADPTVVFAVGDFSLRRVLYKHLEIDSPYNTYKNAGLPPGPIYMPSIASIDAVLNRKDHKYLYFCSSPEVQGAHLFAENQAQHNANARRYHRWLDANGIR